MSMTKAKGGKRRLVSDINVTPLVDVMLVLLIVFMVAAPMMTQGIDVSLHKTTEKPPSREQNDQPLVISISQHGQKFTLGEVEMGRDQLMRELALVPKEEKNKKLFIKPDGDVPYEVVAALFADARGAGFFNLNPVIINR